MSDQNKKYFIPVDGTPIEVSEEVYRAYYQPVWNARYHAQKNGECRCTKAQLWKCDGVCPGCPFYTAGKKVSIDTPIGGEDDELTLGDTLTDDTPSAESILVDKELLDALYDELNRLSASANYLCTTRNVKLPTSWAWPVPPSSVIGQRFRLSFRITASSTTSTFAPRTRSAAKMKRSY